MGRCPWASPCYDSGRKLVKLVKLLCRAILESVVQVLALLIFTIMSGGAIVLLSVIVALSFACRVKDLASAPPGSR